MTGDNKPKAPATADDAGFVQRWSRRKLEKQDADGTPELSAPVPPSGDDETDSEVDIAALEQIDIEALDDSADFTVFMKKGVPEALRNRALRRLWRTNPVLANVDGLNDYDENFRVTHTVLDKFVSAYKIGRGHLRPEDEDDVAVADEGVSRADEDAGPQRRSDADDRDTVDAEPEPEQQDDGIDRA